MRLTGTSKTRGFTLIELLIVIAIIAILALIAIPNFLEAQVRSKVARARADMRTISSAIEAYMTDYSRDPIGWNEGSNGAHGLGLWTDNTRDQAYNAFTTPVAYLTSVPGDPFADKTKIWNDTSGKWKDLVAYEYQDIAFNVSFDADWRKSYQRGYRYYVRCVGPARTVGAPYFCDMVSKTKSDFIYDPSNGTASQGNIHRTNQGEFTSPNN